MVTEVLESLSGDMDFLNYWIGLNWNEEKFNTG